MHDGRLVVCTEVGEIIVLETDGSYSAFVPDSPVENEFKIECIVAFSRGFIIAGDGLIYAFEKSEDPRIPYRLITEPIEVKMDSSDSKSSFGPNVNFLITSMTLSISEDYIYFVTKNKQIMKVEIPLYDGSEQKPKFDFVHCQNHTQEITGLDVCIRKQLIVTCSKDKSVKIWNYVNKTLEISQFLPEEALAVAFHPSGFHIVVAI
jgi:WD40 repeat protein